MLIKEAILSINTIPVDAMVKTTLTLHDVHPMSEFAERNYVSSSLEVSLLAISDNLGRIT